MMAGDPVPAISEAAATDEVAAVFADIRATLGVQVVNLVWRHLATMPGALQACWAALRPAYAAGVIEDAAAAFRAGLALPVLPPWRGVPPGARDVMVSYDRSNSMNLLAVLAMIARIDGAAAGNAPRPPRAPPPPGPALPPLPPGLPPELAAHVQRLNLIGARDGGALMASMWRHLAHWPDVLADAERVLAGIDIGPVISASRSAAEAAARAIPPAMAPHLPPPATRAALVLFADHAIGKMVPICAALRRAAA
jgi:hypothetical protein